MKGVSTAFWSVVLLGATVSIGAGFVGGRSIGSAGALSHARVDPGELPPPIDRRLATNRVLTGAHSLDAWADLDPYGDPQLGVADHRTPKRPYDPLRDPARIAIIVVDAGRAGPALDGFISSALPFTLAVAPTDADAQAALAAAAGAGKAVLVDASSGTIPQVVALVRGGAVGIVGSLGTSRARALLRALDPHAVVVDAALDENDDLYDVARKDDRRALGRDVIADARDDSKYVDFMLRDVLAIAQRNGSAILAVHARVTTLRAVAKFADRAQRDGAQIVPLDEI